jgi:hypothetical protein
MQGNIIEIKCFINVGWESLTKSKNEGVGSNFLGYIGLLPFKK